MKASQIREMSNDDLQGQVKEGKAELFNLRFAKASSKLDNTARIRIVKRNVARAKTELRSRELIALQSEIAKQLTGTKASSAPVQEKTAQETADSKDKVVSKEKDEKQTEGQVK